ncbi:MAG: hypothetical protein LBP69_09835 [Treponema sp.]|jgi:hypothetical protein|nr:hypothetical protein [Treponema sp.]
MITREWLEDEIGKMGRQLEEAKRRQELAKEELRRARAEYGAAAEAVDVAAGVIFGLKQELASIVEMEGK